ncbi:MAG: hypothetical protein HUJ68_11400 [Clostridia bacterium]|nr:hypothetical protein [Clostridia bacterium]
MGNKETLGDLIKGYENNYNITLPKRMPVIVRIDGRAFHTFTKHFEKPFDGLFVQAMQDTMFYLCENISGCQFGYVESDEISLLIYETNDEADPWFANRLQKICSLTASMATLFFNKRFNDLHHIACIDNPKINAAHIKAIEMGATFDSRAFVIPEKVINPYFVWRQNDCTRNSILSWAQYFFSHKEIQSLKCDELQNKMLVEKDFNWNNQPIVIRRGTCAYREEDKIGPVDSNGKLKRVWVLDKGMPILTENREFVMSKIYYPEKIEK